MLSPVIFFNVVMGFIGALQEFDRVFILKSNDGPVGPGESLLVPVYPCSTTDLRSFGWATRAPWCGLFLLFPAAHRIPIQACAPLGSL